MSRSILFLVILIMFSLGAASSSDAADALDHILKTKVLRVAVPEDFPPFGTASIDLQPIGYDIDMARLIAHELGVDIELLPVTSANRISYLMTRKVDLVLSSLGKNPQREKVIDFSQAYAPFFSAVFGIDEQKVSRATDLAGKTIGVTRGAIEDLELVKIVPPTTTIKRFEDNNTTISAFLSGQITLVATGNVVAEIIMERQSDKKMDFKFMIVNSPIYVGLNKNEGRLLERVNGIIEHAKKDGSLDAIARKWMKLKQPVSSLL